MRIGLGEEEKYIDFLFTRSKINVTRVLRVLSQND